MFILTILIHETGHMVFGFLTGYRFLHFEIMGVSLEKINGRMRVRHYKKVPAGQCIMYPAKGDADPTFMILGGPVFNFLAAFVLLICICFAQYFTVKLILLCFFSLNLAVGLFNLFMGSDACDGKTYTDIRKTRELRIFYNCIMLIYKHLREGRSYIDMPGSLFTGTDNYSGSSLAKEMYIHSFRYLYEKGEITWENAAAGDFFSLYVTEHAESVRKRNADRNDVFLKMVASGNNEMYPGEWLSAARSMMEMTKGE